MKIRKLKFWGGVTAALLCVGASLFLLNRILFLAMESARTYANQGAIRQSYHEALLLLGVVVVLLLLSLFIVWKNKAR